MSKIHGMVWNVLVDLRNQWGTFRLGKGGHPHHVLGTSYHIIYHCLYCSHVITSHHVHFSRSFKKLLVISVMMWDCLFCFQFPSNSFGVLVGPANKYGNQDEAIAIEHILVARRSLPCDTSQFALSFYNLVPSPKTNIFTSQFGKVDSKETDFVATESYPPWNQQMAPVKLMAKEDDPFQFERCHVIQVRTVSFRYRVEPMPVINGVITPINGQTSW